MRVCNDRRVQYLFEGLELPGINVVVKHKYEDSATFTEVWLNGKSVCAQALLELLKHSHLVQEALQVTGYLVASDDLDQ